MMSSAFAQSSATAPSNADLKARCDQLISMFDRYGASRSENSDGARNHTRIGAGIDCANGHAAEGVAAMEVLLKNKGFEVHRVENCGVHYSVTIHKWYENWKKNEAAIVEKYGQKWFRMWMMFLSWSVIIGGQGSSTVFMVTMSKNIKNDKTTVSPDEAKQVAYSRRDRWIDLEGDGVIHLDRQRPNVGGLKEKRNNDFVEGSDECEHEGQFQGGRQSDGRHRRPLRRN